ncbi:MAG: hypothetical protein Kow0047_28240 [Anaerolineae bacterium]
MTQEERTRPDATAGEPVAEAEAEVKETEAASEAAPEEVAPPEEAEPTTETQPVGEAEAAPEAAPSLEEITARMAELETELEAARNQAEEYLDQWRRTAAEFSNYRKRQEREQAEFVKQANAGLILRLLPILDDFDLAFEHLPEDVAQSSWVEGFSLIRRKLQAILEQEGVTAIEAVGQPFDPTLHEAISHEESDGVESGHVIAEVRKGYKLGDRVLRPSLVRVAR